MKRITKIVQKVGWDEYEQVNDCLPNVRVARRVALLGYAASKVARECGVGRGRAAQVSEGDFLCISFILARRECSLRRSEERSPSRETIRGVDGRGGSCKRCQED